MSTKSELKRKKHYKSQVKRTPVSWFKRTEDNLRYEYGNYIAYIFQKWSRAERDDGRVPTFANFFNQLLPQDKATVKVEMINQTN